MGFYAKGLYAVADSGFIGRENLQHSVESALLGGASLVQYRNKSGDNNTRLDEAFALAELCNQHRVPLLINDDIDLASVTRAQGVHLGKDDISANEARARLGNEAIIGVSCYNSIELALRSESEGADYVAFGSFFTSATKPDAVKANLDLITEAKVKLNIPVCAIGGITTENAHQLTHAGIDMLAVIQGLFGSADIEKTARQFQNIFNSL